MTAQMSSGLRSRGAAAILAFGFSHVPEAHLNPSVLKSIVDEISLRIVGRRVADVSVPSRDCLELDLAAGL